MYYIKGSKHLYLIDYNFEKNLPVWSNRKEDAIDFMNRLEAVQMKNFLNEQHGIAYEMVYE